ncbi:GtrA family protein [Parasphingopyxis marina]|uniref:GtrA family protein n=1 Tax=Parasphingopyxis marina TaxID=2761622 RepID=A0A842HUQ5_9SPHN|nr:GtrA family protein [Parasphingopyxis marina]MBC2776157.1 GtrA family protein [Parasphingopyxis marina]
MVSSSDLRRQLVRYAISGGALTLFYSAVYWIAAVPMAIDALVANALAFVATVAIGFVVHSRWSFAGHGRRDRPVRAWSLFLAVNLAGFALNSFWVWLIVERIGASPSWPLVPIVFVTPWLSFYLNRRWTFGG